MLGVLKIDLNLWLVFEQKKKNRKQFRTYGLNLVAWTGIEPVTRGFSIAVFVKYQAFMRVSS
jgi:hypothetical protein